LILPASNNRTKAMWSADKRQPVPSSSNAEWPVSTGRRNISNKNVDPSHFACQQYARRRRW
jgi:hypothetical protein